MDPGTLAGVTSGLWNDQFVSSRTELCGMFMPAMMTGPNALLSLPTAAGASPA
ncbi:hypothetical protein SPHINGOAX6_70158 [Sphingomonas sp. AX6]|nr:hypothetical protein SPHINGOAX6_70158 [Sphingomonas sp. AX6]